MVPTSRRLGQTDDGGAREIFLSLSLKAIAVFLAVLLASAVAVANSFDGLNVTDPTWGPSLDSHDAADTYLMTWIFDKTGTPTVYIDSVVPGTAGSHCSGSAPHDLSHPSDWTSYSIPVIAGLVGDTSHDGYLFMTAETSTYTANSVWLMKHDHTYDGDSCEVDGWGSWTRIPPPTGYTIVSAPGTLMDHYGTTYVFVSALDSDSDPVLLWASNASSDFSGSTTLAAMSGSGLSSAAMPSAYEYHPGVDDYTVYVSAAETVNADSTNYIDWWHSSTDTASTDFSSVTSGQQEFNTGTTDDAPLTGCSFVVTMSGFQLVCQSTSDGDFYGIGIDVHSFDYTSTWSNHGVPSTSDTLGRLSVLINDPGDGSSLALLPGDYTSGGDNYVVYWGFGMGGWYSSPVAVDGY